MANRAKCKLRVGDLARVIMANGSLGSTLYRIESIGAGGRCVIREVAKKRYAAQNFDTSMLHQQNDWQNVADVIEGKTTEGPALFAELSPFKSARIRDSAIKRDRRIRGIK